MNSRFFKLIFSRRLNTLVAVGENCTSEIKSTSASLSSSIFNDFSDKNINLYARFAGVLALGFIWVASAFADPGINALPVGGSVAQGSASISQQANQMVINQATDKAVISWQGFDIGAAAGINVLQPNASSVLLNRVVGNDPSQIFGSLTANGHVILVNPNGIVFGADGSVTASAFTASTLGISDADFMAGNYHFVGNGANGSILNQGSINATTDYVALLGASVTNDGKITTNQGNVYMGAAQAITVPVSNSGRIRMELDPASVNVAVNNTQNGVIVTSGGQVLMQASAVNDAIATPSINHAGQINTTATQAGNVNLLADDGNVRVSGSIIASSTNPAYQGGDIIIGRDITINKLAKLTDVSGATLLSNKGFVETSGDWLNTNDISVLAKEWLLDPSDITISNNSSSNVIGTSPADITPNGGSGTSSIVQVSTIQSAINQGTSVTIKTTNVSNPSGAGNITITNALTFANNSNTDATLSLIADNGITQNAAITATGSKLVNISMTANGNFQGNTVASPSSRGIVLNSNIITNGDITLNATVDNPSTYTDAIRFNNTTITARSYNITGTHNNTAIGSNGVSFNGTNIFTATQDSFIRGFTKGSSWPPSMGVYYLNGSNTTFDSGTGQTSVVGVLTGTGSHGSRVSFDSGANITTNSSGGGSVTLGSNEPGASFFHRRGTIRADSGTLNILGTSVTTYEPSAIIQGDNGTTINLIANSVELGTFAGGASVIRPTPTNDAFTLNISTDRLVVYSGSTTSSGTGTTTIQSFSNGTQIDLGADDATGKLGITNAELNSFTAGNLVIGSSNNTGGINLSRPMTTLPGTGNFTLFTGGNINANSTSTLTHNTTGNLTLMTVDNGNITVPKIINNGTGDVLIAAGSNLAAGTSSGGQVRTINGNSITQNSAGKTYIYTGQMSGTGVLAYLDSSFNALYYQGAGYSLNTAFNRAYSYSISGGPNAQVIFREATLPNFSLALPAVTLAKTYGAADPAISDIRAQINNAYTGVSSLTSFMPGVGGNNTFVFSAAEAINSLSGTRVAGNNASTSPYVYALTSSLNIALTGTQPTLRIDKAGLVAVIDNITTTYGTVVPLTAQFSGFAYGENAAGVGISLAGLTSTGYTGNTTTNNVQNGGYAITAASLANQNSTANYYISSISNGTLNINPATISVIANNASKLVTRSDPALTYSYSGLVNGDASSVLTGPTLTRQAGQSAGQYTITAAGASAGNNYTVQYTSGVFRIAGVQELLIQMDNISSIYGASIAPSVQSVEYIDNSSVIFTLSRVANTNTWTDTVGGSIEIMPTLNNVSATSNVGIYQNAVMNTNNGTANSSGNFIGVTTQNANVTILPKPASINISNVNRNYDGSAFTVAQASASTSDLVNGDTIASLGGLSYNGSAIGSVAAGSYTIGANLTNPATASNYLVTINSGILMTLAAVIPTPAKEDKPFVNPVTPQLVTHSDSGSKSQVSLTARSEAVDVKLAALQNPSVAEQCSATAQRGEQCDCQKTLFDDVLLCKVPLEKIGQPSHANQKSKALSNFN
jgi:filamentous hemagglutinin family protein